MDLVKYLSYFFGELILIDHSFQLLFLSTCLAAVLCYALRGKKGKYVGLSWEEEEEIINKFQPKELVPDSVAPPKRRIVQSRAGKFVTVDGHQCLNLVSHNYLGYVEDDDVIRRAADCISKYGVGSCGPRGFYGTADVHLQLEEELAAFFGVEEACVYAYGFSTAASAIPTYCKRRDVIFADEFVNFAIQKGFDAARSTVVYFKHNDMEHLESLLKEAVVGDRVNRQRPRRFLVAEGIYQRSGELCPLPELIRLRKQYQLRMFLDETVSFGVLGATGRGAVEHFDIPVDEVDLRIGSLEGALASVGGFCVGSSFIVEHQRLNGVGYCFSASLPPLLAVAALTSLAHLRSDPSRLQALRKNCLELQEALASLPSVTLGGHPLSPVKLLYPTTSSDYNSDHDRLEKIADECITRGLAVLPPSCLPKQEVLPPRACLRVVASALLNEADIKTAKETLKEVLSASD